MHYEVERIYMTIGCLMLDIQGTTLSEEEMEMLAHPLTGGIILFSRNFHHQQQLEVLCTSIRKAANKSIIIAVDHEGGRVQRFHEKFTAIPAMGSFQHLELSEPIILEKISATGWLMAAELISSGIDISFAPVLDVDAKISKVIGDRGFSDKPETIISYSTAFIQGMNRAGMSATGKHFPGHGSTVEDSHFDIPVDERSLEQIRSHDLSIFKAVCKQGLSAVMPAHVIYSAVDPLPACFSPYWLQTVLRDELTFSGTVFSDDLSMAGAKAMGDIKSRAQQALSAGCDMILCCNDQKASIELLDNLPQQKNTDKVARIQSMIPKANNLSFSDLTSNTVLAETNQMIKELEQIV